MAKVNALTLQDIWDQWNKRPELDAYKQAVIGSYEGHDLAGGMTEPTKDPTQFLAGQGYAPIDPAAIRQWARGTFKGYGGDPLTDALNYRFEGIDPATGKFGVGTQINDPNFGALYQPSKFGNAAGNNEFTYPGVGGGLWGGIKDSGIPFIAALMAGGAGIGALTGAAGGAAGGAEGLWGGGATLGDSAGGSIIGGTGEGLGAGGAVGALDGGGGNFGGSGMDLTDLTGFQSGDPWASPTVNPSDPYGVGLTDTGGGDPFGVGLTNTGGALGVGGGASTGLQAIWEAAQKIPGGVQQFIKALSSGDNKALGAILSAGLGAYGANQQANSLQALSDKYMAMGAPYRAELDSSLRDPATYLRNSPDIQASVGQGTDFLAKALSARKGNPIGDGGALGELQNYATNALYGKLGEKQNRLASYGGLSNFNAAAPAAANATIGAQGGIYNALGYGANELFNPQPTTAQTLADLYKLINAQKQPA